MARFDTDGKRIGSEITQSHRAWGESCGWHGIQREGYGSGVKAETDGMVHDMMEHA